MRRCHDLLMSRHMFARAIETDDLPRQMWFSRLPLIVVQNEKRMTQRCPTLNRKVDFRKMFLLKKADRSACQLCLVHKPASKHFKIE